MPLNYGNADYDFEGDSEGFGAHLEAQFQLQQDNVEALDADMAAQTVALHGHGRIDGLVLGTGTGLAASLTVGNYLAAGRLYSLLAPAAVSLPASATRYIYMDGTGAFTLYAAQPAERPAGTWYVGSATTDGVAVTGVDQADCDEVASLAVLLERIADLEAADDALDERVTLLEEGGGGGGGGAVVYAYRLPWAPGDGRTNEQVIDEKIADAVEGLGSGGTGGGSVSLAVQYDTDVVNQAYHLLKTTQTVDPETPVTQVDAVTIVPGVYGDGSGGSPDFWDRVNSTWDFDA